MQTIKLGEIAELHGRVGWKGYTVEDLTDSGPLVLGANDITSDNQLSLANVKHLTREKYEESPEIFVRSNDILVVKVGSTIGKVCIIKDDIGEASINPNCVIVRATKINPYYLYYYLCSPAGQAYLINNSAASGQPALNQENIRNMKVPVISEFEQENLSSVLNSIAEKIANNSAICSDLEAMAKLLYDYWFVQFDFPDENGKPYKSNGGKMVWNEELKREIPEGWKAGTFGDVLSTLECGNRPAGGAEKDGIPSIGAENIIGIGRYDYSSEKYVSEEYFSKMQSGIVCAWDVLIYKDGAGVGQSSMFGDGFPYDKCAINSHAFILRSKENLYQDYLYLTLNQEYVKKIIVALAMKAAQPGLNQPAVKSIPLLIPKLSVTKAFNEKCDALFHHIFARANESKDLASLRDFLLPMLMNGQAKVGG